MFQSIGHGLDQDEMREYNNTRKFSDMTYPIKFRIPSICDYFIQISCGILVQSAILSMKNQL